MEVSQRADHLRLVLKQYTALDLCCFQVIQGVEGPIGNPFISSPVDYFCCEWAGGHQ